MVCELHGHDLTLGASNMKRRTVRFERMHRAGMISLGPHCACPSLAPIANRLSLGPQNGAGCAYGHFRSNAAASMLC